MTDEPRNDRSATPKLSENTMAAWQRYSEGDTSWLARNQPHVRRMRQALVDCATEIRAVPNQDDYSRWRRRQIRKGRREATVFMLELIYPHGWDSALYDAGLISTPPPNGRAR